MRTLFFVSTVLLALLMTGSALAAGYAIWEMGARSSAMGGVMTASPDDPSAIFFNPAGLARLDGRQLSASLTIIRPYQEFSGVAPSPGYGVTEKLEDRLHFLPQGYFSWRLGTSFAAGLGFTTPYGLSVEWDDPENYSGRHLSVRSELRSYFVSPTVAYAPSDRLSIGLGLNLVFSQVDLEQYVVRNIPDPTYVGKADLSGSGDPALGFNLGALVEVTESVTLGISYKNRIDLDFEGDVDFTAFDENIPLEDGDVATELPLPSLISLGIAGRVHEKLLLEFNYDRIQWSAFELLELRFIDLDETVRFDQDYVNSSQYRFGAEYAARPELDLRAGVVFDQSPQPSKSVGPLLPDADRTGLSIGAGYRFDEFSVDVYNLFLFFEEREIRDNRDGYNGDYRNYTNLFGLGLNYRF